jgi:hypothetical protein
MPQRCIGIGSLAGRIRSAAEIRRSKTRIGWLQQHGVIADEHGPQWEGFRELRNDSSHAEMQSLFTPGNAYTMLRIVAECVNALHTPPSLGRASA